MKKFIATALLTATATLSITMTTAPASAQMTALKSIETAAISSETAIVHKTGSRGRYGGHFSVGTSVIPQQFGDHGRDTDDDVKASHLSRDEKRCLRWDQWCEEYDNERACKKFDDRC